jgi:endonuclease/exonuclease/phosphatase family metal-dependent hydrolase
MAIGEQAGEATGQIHGLDFNVRYIGNAQSQQGLERGRTERKRPNWRHRIRMGLGVLALLGTSVKGAYAGDGPQNCEPRTFEQAGKTALLAGHIGEAAALNQRLVNLMTYNIAGARPQTDKLNKIAELVKSGKPDVAALQEVWADSISDLQERTGMNVYFAPAASFNGRPFGNAILTNPERVKVLDQHTVSLGSSPGHENRVMQMVWLEINGKRQLVITTHLANNDPGIFGDEHPGARVEQATQAMRAVAASETSHIKVEQVVLMGDLNAATDSQAGQIIANAGFTDMFDAAGAGNIVTFPSDQGTVDHILIRSAHQFEPFQLGVTGGDLTDHCALVAREYTGGPALTNN